MQDLICTRRVTRIDFTVAVLEACGSPFPWRRGRPSWRCLRMPGVAVVVRHSVYGVRSYLLVDIDAELLEVVG